MASEEHLRGRGRAPWWTGDAARAAIALLAIGAIVSTLARAQQGDGTRVQASTNVWKPAKVEATGERIAALKVPAGFKVSVFASGLKNVRVIAVAPNGDVYASRRDQGDVVLLRDADADGRADNPPAIVANRPHAHGLAIRDNRLYLVTVKELYFADIKADGTLGPLTLLTKELPDAGQHANRTLAFGPDGMLYASIGSTCNACNEANAENATILRMTPDGKQRTIVASGLRNTIGFAWHPVTGELWGMDNGIDFLGDEVQPEELNRIEAGHQYGWPHVWGDGGLNPQSTPPGEITKEQWRALSTPMVLGYIAHAAPMQMVFYPAGGSFPAEYHDDAFVTMRGSWNRNPASGYEIVRIHFADGQPKSFEPFVTGFLTDGGAAHFARPMGLAIARDGALLMGDDANGVIYRIAAVNATPGAAVPPTAPAPAARMLAQAAKGDGVPLASERVAPREAKRLTVTSPALRAGAAIPMRYSEYAEGVSPPLQWTALPEARSYALLMEDPDAKPVAPFVHWVAWNIPAATTRLPEGLQEQPRLTEPEGLLQGLTTRGSIGYFGPRPPVGDRPHRYVIQVFALDTMLELPPGADRDTLVAAMKGHVIGSGVLVGRFGQATPPPQR
ncbi:MAG: YbhB/YbcL family Raf kinase inhibitor-like protein [Burkholderiales bacterium]